jgi:hypothetical protein
VYTSLLGIALEIVLSAAGPTPNWQPDYKQARLVAAKENRPVVVVLASGSSGWNKLVSEGRFQDAFDLTLRSKYVWVYVDIDTEKGKKLADDFQIKSGPGLIISGRGGDLQAYRRVGAMDSKGLKEVLAKYAETERVVRRTETSGESAAVAIESASYYPPALNQCLT